jgi:MFS family permease
MEQSVKANDNLAFSAKVILLIVISLGIAWGSSMKLNLGLVPGIVVGASFCGLGIFALMRLGTAPREVWVTYGLKLVSVTAYKILNFTLAGWLANDLGFDKQAALSIIAAWSVFMTVATILSGSITDVLGLRKTLIIGVTLCVISRLFMITMDIPWLIFVFAMIPLAIGEALCTPVLVASLRKFTAPSQRTVAFSLFYALMNFGFMIGYFASDAVTKSVVGMDGASITLLGLKLSQYQALLFTSMALELLMLPLVLMMRKAAVVEDLGLVGLGYFAGIRHTISKAFHDVVHLLSTLFSTKGFYRLLLFLALIGLLKIVFNVMDYVLPTFTEQELGKGVNTGRFNAVNGILILILAPAIGLMTQKFSAYSMVILGGFITAASFLFIALPPEFFQGAADGWLGKVIGNGYMELKGAVHPYYVMIVLWQVLFSIGEAFYSPRVYEYAAAIAPEGQEASYSSLSYIPLLLGKLITGAAFGGLLERYCPAEGERNPEMMWTIIGLMVLVAPLGLWFLRGQIRVKEEGRE